MTKSKDFSYLTLTGIVFTLLLITFMVGKIFPFGQNSFLCYDFYYQIVDITANIFNGGRGIFFTFDLANGCSMLANMFYSCASPFTFILLLGGPNNVRYLTPVMITLKFITIALVFLWFLKKQFKLNNFYNILLALLYTFSSFTFMAITQPVWLDLAIYFPLLFMAFKHMKETGKIRYFALILSLMIVTSFSLSIFTMLFLLVIFMGYLFFCVKKEDRSKLCFKLILSYAIAISATLFITIPSLIEMAHSSRMNGLLDGFTWTKPQTFLDSKIGFLLASCLPIILSIITIIKNFKTPNGKFYLFTFVLCLLPILIDNINVAVNFSRYAGYPLRLGALFNFVFVFLSAKYFSNKQEFADSKSKPIHFIILGVLCLFSIILGIVNFSSFGKSIANSTFPNIILICLAVFFLLLLLTLGLTNMHRKKGQLSKKASKILVTIASSIMLIFSTLTYLGGSSVEIGSEQNYHLYQSTIVSDDNYANVKSRLTMKQLSGGYSSISGFSSMIDKNAIKTYTNLGYTNNSHNINSNNGNLFADMLAGIRYEISDVELNLPYLDLVETAEDSYLYEYNLYLGHTYYANELPEINDNDDLVTRLNKMYTAITRDSEPLLEKQNFELIFDVPPTKEENLLKFEDSVGTLNFTAEKECLLYINFDSSFKSIAISSNLIAEKGSTLLGYLKADENLNTTIEFAKGSEVTSYEFYSLDYQKIVNFAKEQNESKPNVKYTKNSISVEFETDDKYLVVNHPAIYGYKYELNGSACEVSSFAGFVTFDLSNLNSGSAKITYSYPSLKLALAGLIAGILFLAIIIPLAYIKNPNKKFMATCKYLLIIFTSVISIYFFAVPMIAVCF